MVRMSDFNNYWDMYIVQSCYTQNTRITAIQYFLHLNSLYIQQTVYDGVISTSENSTIPNITVMGDGSQVG